MHAVFVVRECGKYVSARRADDFIVPYQEILIQALINIFFRQNNVSF